MAEAVATPDPLHTTHRRIWRLALPIVLSNLTIPLLGAVDTAVVGHLGSAHHIGAVALGALIFSFLYWGFGFLRMGTTGFAAQAYGARDHDEMRAVLARSLVLGLGIGIAVIAVQVPVRWLAFALLEGSQEVETLAASYFAIRIWGAPAAIATYALFGWFVGMHDTRAVFILLTVTNGVNIVLDVVFVFGLGFGVPGVAAATVLAEYAGVAVGAALAWRKLRRLGGTLRRAHVLDTRKLRRLLSVNLDIFIRTICLIGGLAFFTAQGAKQGDAVLAANAVLMNLYTFMAYGLDGFAFAAEALVGAAIGANSRAALRVAVRLSSVWALLTAGAFAATYAVIGVPFIDLLTSVPEVRTLAREYLPWAVLSPLVAVWSFQLDGIFIGAVRSRDMRNAMVLSLACYLAAVLVLQPWLGNHGLWFALTIFLGARGLTLALRYPALERAVPAQQS